LTFLVLAVANGRPLALSAQSLDAQLDALGQVRDGDLTRKTEAPVDFYGDLAAAGLPYGTSIESYFRLNRDLARDDGEADFYMRVPHLVPGTDVTVGRQFLSEVPGGVFVADAGKITVDAGLPFTFTAFGGEPRYFEPTYGNERFSQDEQIWGGRISAQPLGARVNVGYLQQRREGKTVRQLVSATAARSFAGLPGSPTVYTTTAFDADRQNIDLATLGFNTFVAPARVLLNFESGYYKPQDHGEHVEPNIDRREDSIFEIFSVSEMLQFRGGLTHYLTTTVSAFADYSYQHYEALPGSSEDGHVARGGVTWLPEGDGLELVRLEYYLIDSDGGNVNGGRLHYENRVYERLVFRSNFDLTYYEKESNQEDTAFSSLLGLGYLFTPALFCEVNFEANTNKRFDEDFRFGFWISYRFRGSVDDWKSDADTQGDVS
jgi:hypothetical protein